MTTTQTPTGSAAALYPAPLAVSATIDQADKITVSWAAAAGATSYSVWRGAAYNGAGATMLDDGITDLTFDDTTAADETVYYYFVKAVYAGGTSAASGIATGWKLVGVPAAPTSVAATDSDYDKITVSWDAAAGAEFYEVWQSATNDSGTAARITTVGGLSIELDTVTPGETLYFWVKAGNMTGFSAFSASDSGLRPAPPVPDAPTGVAATDSLTSVITISWGAVAFATSYSVWRATTSGGTYTEIASDLTGTSYNDTTQIGVTRYYKVKATNASGTSGFSAYDDGYAFPYVPPPPDAPTGVSATDGDEGQVTVSWGAVTGADTYSVWRAATDSSGAATEIASGIAGTSYDDTTATPDTVFYYFVKATNAYGTSGFSASDGGYLTVPPPPAEPDGVTATDGTAYDKVTVTWDAVAGAVSYKVYRSDTVFGTKTLLAAGIAGTSYDDESLTDTDARYYWVKATNTGGDSDYGPLSAAESGYAAVPADPSSVSATDGTEPLKVTVTWGAAAGAVTYSVYRSTTYGGTKTLLAAGISGTSYDDESLTDFGGYFYWVVAVNGVGSSGYAGGDNGSAGGPATPAISSITTTEVEAVTLTWGAAAGAASYGVWRATTDSFGAATQIATGLAALSYDDDTAAFDTGLYYFVVAESALGDGLPSPSAYGFSPGTLPGVPTLFSVYTVGIGVHVEWYVGTGYNFDVGLAADPDPDTGNVTNEDLGNVTVHVWSPAGLAATGYYPQYYFVRGRNRFGVSAWSEPSGAFYTP